MESYIEKKETTWSLFVLYLGPNNNSRIATTQINASNANLVIRQKCKKQEFEICHHTNQAGSIMSKMLNFVNCHKYQVWYKHKQVMFLTFKCFLLFYSSQATLRNLNDKIVFYKANNVSLRKKKTHTQILITHKKPSFYTSSINSICMQN